MASKTSGDSIFAGAVGTENRADTPLVQPHNNAQGATSVTAPVSNYINIVDVDISFCRIRATTSDESPAVYR